MIITLIVLSGTIFRDATRQSSRSEWSACDRPLGVWACLWVLRVIIAFVLSYWDYRRELEALHRFASGAPMVVRRGNRTSQVSRSDRRWHRPIRQQGIIVSLPNATFTRLSVLSSVITLSWFLAAHILEYTSINTCRQTSPHLWWLVFGMLCIMYLMVFELVIIGFIVLIITPIVFVSCAELRLFQVDNSSRFSGISSLFVWAATRFKIRILNQILRRFPKCLSKKSLS